MNITNIDLHKMSGKSINLGQTSSGTSAVGGINFADTQHLGENSMYPYDNTPVASYFIYYTSTNGEIVEPSSSATWGSGVTLVSNTYEENQGVLGFDGEPTTIGANAFSGCTTLESIDIPSGITSIGNGAFKDCTSLEEVNIPSSITSIGAGAFSGCTGLSAITVNSAVPPTVLSGAFDNVASVGILHVTVPLADYSSWIGTVLPQGWTIDSPVTSTMNYTSTNGQVVEPSSAATWGSGVSIYSNTYSNNQGTIVFLGVPTEIGNDVFSGCTTLEEVNIPSSVTFIGATAFAGCTSLSSITIPDNVTGIGSGAFKDCTSLSAVTIGSGVDYIGSMAFMGCTALESVTIPDNVTDTSDDLFYGCTSLSSVTIGSGLTSLYHGMFAGCTSLEEVNIPSGITDIGYSVFQGCTGLTSITVNSAVPPTVLSDAFTNVASAGTLYVASYGADYSSWIGTYLPSGWTIDTPFGELRYTSSDNQVITPNSATTWGAGVTILENTYSNNQGKIVFSGKPTEIGDYAFQSASTLTSIEVPDTVTSLGTSAFNMCTGLTSFDLNNVTEISDRAFESCRGITSMTVPSGVTSFGSYVFSDCWSLESLTFAGNVNSMTSIEGVCPYCYALTSVTLPSTLLTLGASCFTNCDHLTSFDFSRYTGLKNIGDCCFAGCTALTSDLSTALQNIETIGIQAFRYDHNIVGAPNLNSLQSIGREAFQECWMLGPTIDMSGSTLTTITESAFDYCQNCYTVTLPSTLASIDSKAFHGWTQIYSVICNATIPPTLADDAFDFTDVWSKAMLHVPTGLREYYRLHKNWAYFDKIIDGVNYDVSSANNQWMAIPSGTYFNTGIKPVYPFAGLVYYIVNTEITPTNDVDSGRVWICGSRRTSTPSESFALLANKNTSNTIRISAGAKNVEFGPTLTANTSSYRIQRAYWAWQSSSNNTLTYTLAVKGYPNSGTNWGKNTGTTTGVTHTGMTTGSTTNYPIYIGACNTAGSVNTGTDNAIAPRSQLISYIGFDSGYTSFAEGPWNKYFYQASRDNGSAYFKSKAGNVTRTISPQGGRAYFATQNAYYLSSSGGTLSGVTSSGNWGPSGERITAETWDNSTKFGNAKFTATSDDQKPPVYISGFTLPADMISFEVPESIFTLKNFEIGSGTKVLLLPAILEYIKDSFNNLTIDSDCWIYFNNTMSVWNNIVKSNCFTNAPDLIIHCTDGDTLARGLKYTSSTGNIVSPNSAATWGSGVSVVSNTYENGYGIITFNKAPTEVGDHAFDNISGLKSVVIPQTCKSIGYAAFWNNTTLSSVTFGKNVEEISYNAFELCTSLTGVTLPNSLQYIRNSAFNRSGLLSLDLPDSVIEVGWNAFLSASTLSSVTIGTGIQYLRGSAFSNCTSLTSITCNATTAPSIESSTFEAVGQNGTLYVPSGSSGYDDWMSTGDYYLGKYNWSKVEQ